MAGSGSNKKLLIGISIGCLTIFVLGVVGVVVIGLVVGKAAKDFGDTINQISDTQIEFEVLDKTYPFDRPRDNSVTTEMLDKYLAAEEELLRRLSEEEYFKDLKKMGNTMDQADSFGEVMSSAKGLMSAMEKSMVLVEVLENHQMATSEYTYSYVAIMNALEEGSLQGEPTMDDFLQTVYAKAATADPMTAGMSPGEYDGFVVYDIADMDAPPRETLALIYDAIKSGELGANRMALSTVFYENSYLDYTNNVLMAPTPRAPQRPQQQNSQRTPQQ